MLEIFNAYFHSYKFFFVPYQKLLAEPPQMAEFFAFIANS